jgi:methylenetetrahydrofolate dehydrogenase (NADP+)/methenyltetrahydrofolate cyclohydrolase
LLRLDGKVVAEARRERLKTKIAHFTETNGRKPGLAVVIVGADPASQVYVKSKVKTTTELGMASTHIELPETATQAELLDVVKTLNEDGAVDGILVQLPLPKHIDATTIVEAIHPEKDPDGLTTGNLGLLLAGRMRVAPCTPFGVMKILEHYGIELKGKRATVVGRSNIVGKPMAQLLLDADATVTIAHSKTKDLRKHTLEADIVVVAAGKPKFLGKGDFSKDAVVIDVGIHRTEGNKVCGDVRFKELDVKAATPVPGGVGPMTIQMLMENTLTLAEKRLASVVRA